MADKKEKKEKKKEKEKKEKKSYSEAGTEEGGGGASGAGSGSMCSTAAAAAAGAVAGLVASQAALQQQQQRPIAGSLPAGMAGACDPAVAPQMAPMTGFLPEPGFGLAPPVVPGLWSGPPPVASAGDWYMAGPATPAMAMQLPAQQPTQPPTQLPQFAHPCASSHGPAMVGGGGGAASELERPPASLGLGSAAMHEDYRRCLLSLESMVMGPLQQKKAALVETAQRVEASMEAVQRAAGVVRSETAADVQGVTERLEAAERQKLSLLQVD